MVVRPERLVDLLAPWLGSRPTYLALASGLRGLALDGRLPVGAKLPSERQLATVLHVARNTVTAAYDVLRDEGYLRSDHGAGSRIVIPAAVPARPDAEPALQGDLLDLTVAALPAPGLLLEAVERATVALRPLLAGHGLHPLGLPALRESVARHLSTRGLRTRPEQVLITNGALHGWDLLLRTLARPGNRVLVEQPTYPAVLDAVGAHRLRAVALPVTAAGWDFPTGIPPGSLVHITPDAQNPTGLLASNAQREQLHRALQGALLVVDETFADLVLEGARPRPMAALDRSIVTLGSMSKAFWAGLRVGWVRTEPELVARLAQARSAQDLAGPVLDQLVAAELLDHAEALLPERRQLLQQSRDALVTALSRELPDWRWVVPRSGMVLWVELPGSSATRLAAQALELGVRLTAGPRFTVRGTADRWVRLPYTLPADQMQTVAALLRKAAERVDAGTPTSRPMSRWTA
jgi:DNA-binding transcriptional MocR family regulator